MDVPLNKREPIAVLEILLEMVVSDKDYFERGDEITIATDLSNQKPFVMCRRGVPLGQALWLWAYGHPADRVRDISGVGAGREAGGATAQLRVALQALLLVLLGIWHHVHPDRQNPVPQLGSEPITERDLRTSLDVNTIIRGIGVWRSFYLGDVARDWMLVLAWKDAPRGIALARLDAWIDDNASEYVLDFQDCIVRLGLTNPSSDRTVVDGHHEHGEQPERWQLLPAVAIPWARDHNGRYDYDNPTGLADFGVHAYTPLATVGAICAFCANPPDLQTISTASYTGRRRWHGNTTHAVGFPPPTFYRDGYTAKGIPQPSLKAIVQGLQAYKHDYEQYHTVGPKVKDVLLGYMQHWNRLPGPDRRMAIVKNWICRSLQVNLNGSGRFTL